MYFFLRIPLSLTVWDFKEEHLSAANDAAVHRWIVNASYGKSHDPDSQVWIRYWSTAQLKVKLTDKPQRIWPELGFNNWTERLCWLDQVSSTHTPHDWHNIKPLKHNKKPTRRPTVIAHSSVLLQNMIDGTWQDVWFYLRLINNKEKKTDKMVAAKVQLQTPAWSNAKKKSF